MTKPEGEARMDCRDAVWLLREIVDASRVGYGGKPVLRSSRVNYPAGLFHRAVAALSAPVPTGEGEAVAWRYWSVTERWVYTDNPTLASANADLGIKQEPLYAHPKPAQGEGVEALREKVARIIDPAAFLFDRDELDDKVWSRSRAAVFAQADAILAALTTGKGGEG